MVELEVGKGLKKSLTNVSMIKFFKSSNYGYKYPLPSGFHLIYDLVPLLVKEMEDLHNLASLEERDRTPRKKKQREISTLQEQRIISLRKKYLTESKFNLAIYYQREHKEPISSWKVQKVIERYHLYYHPQKVARIRNKRQRTLKKKRITELKGSRFSCS